MHEWTYAQNDPSERLAAIHHFSIKKIQPDGEIDFTITVKEFSSPQDPAARFVAQTDKQTNQKVAPYTPTGWGTSLFEALSSCMKAVDRFPYQG